MTVSHPDMVEKMVSFASVGYEIHADGKVTSRSTGGLKFVANPPPELTLAGADINHFAPSGAGVAIALHDSYVLVSQPFGSEMPGAIFDVVASEPTGEIAEMYRGYVRHTLMPLMQRVADMLREHSAYMELPPKAWLEQKFPGLSWKVRRSQCLSSVPFQALSHVGFR